MRHLLAWLRLARLMLRPSWPHSGDRRWIEKLKLMSEPSPTAVPAPTEPTPPPRSVTLYLVRHGQSTFNTEKRLPGQLPDIHLTAEGQHQAQKLGEAVREMPLTAVISSPLDRARETAELVLSGRDVPLLFEPRLMDTDVGRWSGQIIDDLYKNDPEWVQFVRRPTHPPDGIEGFYQVLSRIVAAAEAARHNEQLGDAIMLVAHADVVKLLICHYLRLPIEGTSWLHIPNASLTALAFVGDQGPSVVALNWTPSPDWLRPAAPADNTTVANATVEKNTASERGEA